MSFVTVKTSRTGIAGPFLRTMCMALLALVLASCGGARFDDLFSESAPRQPTVNPQPVQPVPGTGAKVALLLPLDARGQTANIGKAMKQAAELAMFDAGGSGITLITKATSGDAASAKAAATTALAEGAQLVLGPLLGAEVKAISPLTRAANVPVIAFSSVSAVAGPGIYLMSFLPEEEVHNVVRHAVATGRRNIAALIPKSQYGTITERALKEAAKLYGAQIVATERFARTPGGISGPATRIARAVNDPSRGIQALFIPEGGQLLRSAGVSLTASGFAPATTKLMGTGLWDDSVTVGTPVAQGGWYAGVDPAKTQAFEQRYAKTYGTKPPRLASLAYDAVSLAIILARSGGFSDQQIQNPEGFQGINGLFRFRANGRIQRGLAILQITGSGPQIVAPAPTRFGGGT